MAKSSRTILFLAAQENQARHAAELFLTSCKRLGLAWNTKAEAIAGSFDTQVLESASVLVAMDLPNFALSEGSIRLERITVSAGLEQAVSGLIARLLGGSDAPATEKPPPSPPQPPKKIHTVKVSRETAGRKGKGVTVISDLPLNEEEIKELATTFKNKCGTGGTAKDGRIEIQGDHRDKLVSELEKLGYKVKRAGG